MPNTYSIQPVTLTWQHNTYVTIGLEISADGALRVYKASGGGTANNMKICYPQSDTFVQANVITKIDIPQSEGQHSMAITVWWDNQSGQNNDHNNHTITFTVVASGSSDNNKVVLSDGTVLIDLTSDTVDAEHLLQGYTAHDKSGALITGTASGGSDITIEPLSVTANGVYTAASGKAYTPVTVNVSGGTSGEVDSGVIFIDYDGTIVDAWNSSDVAGKTALPSNPTHDGLVAQGWNWTLANIKSHIANYQNAVVFVGQMYETESGLTEMDITVTKVTGKTVTCKMEGNKDWGDGTTDSTTSHTYEDYGDYTITCNGTSIPAGTSSSGGMFGSSSSNMNRFWCTAIRIGDGVTSIGNYALRYCYSLSSITIPNGVTSIGNNYAFANCYSLSSITIPNGVTRIGTYAFSNCYSLTSVTIPDSVTTIDGYTFEKCYSLTSVTIPDSVVSIGNYTFSSCYSLVSITIPDSVLGIDMNALASCYSLTSVTIPDSVKTIYNNAFSSCYSILEYDFSSATSVPTLSNTNALTGINGICKIIVPDALYDSWKTATNWSTYANYIYKSSEVAA